MKNNLVLSDLHIFSSVSRYKALLPELVSRINSCSTVVLNGDTFDFKRSHLKDTKTTVLAARALLVDLLSKNPRCNFFYVVGNHDNVRELLVELELLTKEFNNFSLHNEVLKIGKNLFLHGDVCDGPKTSEELIQKRAKYLDTQPDLTSIKLSKLIIALKLNLVTDLIHPAKLMAKRILLYLENSFPDLLETTEVIYFGHTHAVVSGFSYQGKSFYNTGSWIYNLGLREGEFGL